MLSFLFNYRFNKISLCKNDTTYEEEELVGEQPEVEEVAEGVPEGLQSSALLFDDRLISGLQAACPAHRPRDGEVAGHDGAAVLPHRGPPPRYRDDRVPVKLQ